MKGVFSLAAMFLVATLLLCLAIGTPKEILAVTIGIVLFSLPGFSVYRLCLGKPTGGSLAGLFHGAVIGICLSSFVAIMLGSVIRWDVATVACGIVVASATLYLLSRRRSVSDRMGTPWVREDYMILFASLIVVVLAIAYPLVNVGKQTNAGFAYAHLFGLDFIQRASFAACIANSMPPGYLYFSGNVLPTYWIFYVLPAYVYLILGRAASLQSIMLLTQVVQAVLFTGGLFCLLRLLIKRRISIVLCMCIAVCAYSYYDLYVLLKNIARVFPFFSSLSIGKVDLTNFSTMSHSVFRDFLFEPQAALCLSVLLVIVRFFAEEAPVASLRYRYATIGLLMAFSLGIDAFIGMIVVMWCTLVFVLRYCGGLRNKSSRSELNAVFALIVFSIVFFCYEYVGMYSLKSGNSGLLIRPYYMIMLLSPFYFVIELGPAFIFGVLGIAGLWRTEDYARYRNVVLLAAVAIAISLVLRHHIEVNVGLRKGAYVTFVPLVVLCGTYFDRVFSVSRPRRPVKILISVLLLLAIPTLFTDIHTASDIKNDRNTTYLSAADQKACSWIKNNTPIDAIVQSEPEYPSRYGYSLIASFAERTMVAGESRCALFIRKPNIGQLAKERRRDVRTIFSSGTVNESLDIIKKYGINFIYAGPYEQRLYPGAVGKFEGHPEVFRRVYFAEGVNIYQVDERKTF